MPNNDLISRKALIEQIEEDAKHMMFTSHHSRMLHDDMVEFAINAIECAPTVDAEPARHGKWENINRNEARCSECKIIRNIGNETGWNFCPNCGAKMDKEE